MKLTKYLAAIFCILMLLSFVAGCTKEQDTSTSTDNETVAEKTAEETDVEKEDPISIHLITRQMGTCENHTDNSVLLMIEEELNLDINWEVKPNADYGTTCSVILASGDYPDAMEIWFSDPVNDIKDYAEGGLILELTSLLEEYGQDILACRPEATWYHPLNDESVYSIQSRCNVDGIEHCFTIRQDWLDNLGLDVPTTLQEFYDVAYAFTYDDPDGDGVNNTYGLAPSEIGKLFTASPLSAIFSAFGTIDSTYGRRYVKQGNGEVIYWAEQPEVKDAIEYARKMYQDGLMEPEFPLMTRELYLEQKNNNKYGIEYWGLTQLDPSQSAWIRAFYDAVPEAELTIMPPLKDANGKSYAARTSQGILWTVWCVFANSEQPEACIRVLNWLATDYGALTAAIGVEGETWEYIEGKPTVFENIDPTIQANSGGFLYSWAFRQNTFLLDTSEFVLNGIETIKKSEAIFPLVSVFEPISSLTDYGSTINDIENAKIIDLITKPSIDYDTAYDAFIAEWKANGGDKVLEELNQVYGE